MTPHGGPTNAGPSSDDLSQLADRIHRSITEAFDEWTSGADASPEEDQPVTPTFARPVAVTPVRMEQLARAPEPTADLDDLVDLLVPRLLEQLVPALRDALRDDA
jgi:hypothetical protein